ncbi:MAG: PorT family protein [Saprospiraceae bacterium]|nr:PorT family protein [Saprospiraceae bacterium]
MNRSLCTILILTLFIGGRELFAQNRLSYGFKAGLNYNTFNGPLDEAESYDRGTGFHIGVIFKYALTDIFGLKGEFAYTQRGGKYSYDGSSFFLVQRDPNPILVTGNRNMTVNISNNYLDFPLLAYGKFGRFEINAGISISLLAGSVGAGQLKFTGTSPVVNEFNLNLDYRFLGDEAREASQFGTQQIRISNEQVSIPTQVGAYYEYDTKDGNLFRFLELGYIAGLNFYLNEGLYLGVRGNFGLLDVTRSQMDRSFSSFSGNVPMLRNDKDTQISYQLSLGFSF